MIKKQNIWITENKKFARLIFHLNFKQYDTII